MNRILKSAALLAFGTFFSETGMAQQKPFTLDELLGGGDAFWQLRADNVYTQWWGDMPLKTAPEGVSELNTGKSICSVEQINKLLGEKAAFSGHNLSFPYTGKPIVNLTKGLRHILLNFESGEKVLDITLPDGASHQDFNKTSLNTAYTIQGNLYIMKPDGTSMAVSEDGSIDGSENIVYGWSVHRDEFGINKGTFWSPDGKRLAYYRMDQSMVPGYPQVDIHPQKDYVGSNGSRIATTYTDHYPMVGEKSHIVKVGIFNTETGENTWLDLEGASDDYHTNISWAPDGNTIYVFELNRDQNDMRLVAYNTTTGKLVKTILQECDEKYVEPMTGLTFIPWDSNKAIMQSQRDGYNHLYLLDVKSGNIKQITKGNWVVQEFIGFNTIAKSVIFRSNEIDPRTSCLYSVKTTGGKRTLLGKGEGVCYQAYLNSNGTQVISAYTAPEVPRSINLLSTTTGNGKNILTAEDKWKKGGYAVPEFKSGTIKAADGVTNLYYRMVLPPDFDATKKYPAIVYVYGGPHAHLVEASWHWDSRGWETYMAQKGYILFILDNRGSEWRGKAFEQTTFRQLGCVEREDQFKGIEYLKSLPYIDADRIGVHGWSFGGFMTTNLMLTYPETFKVGVAGGPVIDWKYYEVMYGERYMDTPQQNPDGYEKCNLRNRAGNLKGRLQLIIGYNDPTCVPQQSLSFIRACEDAGAQPDFFVYPGGEHNMYGKDAVHLHERITRYFEDFLK